MKIEKISTSNFKESKNLAPSTRKFTEQKERDSLKIPVIKDSYTGVQRRNSSRLAAIDGSARRKSSVSSAYDPNSIDAVNFKNAKSVPTGKFSEIDHLKSERNQRSSKKAYVPIKQTQSTSQAAPSLSLLIADPERKKLKMKYNKKNIQSWINSNPGSVISGSDLSSFRNQGSDVITEVGTPPMSAFASEVDQLAGVTHPGGNARKSAQRDSQSRNRRASQDNSRLSVSLFAKRNSTMDPIKEETYSNNYLENDLEYPDHDHLYEECYDKHDHHTFINYISSDLEINGGQTSLLTISSNGSLPNYQSSSSRLLNGEADPSNTKNRFSKSISNEAVIDTPGDAMIDSISSRIFEISTRNNSKAFSDDEFAELVKLQKGQKPSLDTLRRLYYSDTNITYSDVASDFSNKPSSLNLTNSLLNIFDFMSDEQKLQRRDRNLEGISYQEFSEILDKDEVFIDYFNKFLVLPCFGTTLYYDKLQKDYSVFPHLNDKQYNCQVRKVKKYLYGSRFLRFIQTPYYLEYRLNIELLKVEYLTSKSEDPNVKQAFEFLKQKYLSGASRMRNFRKFLLAGVNNQNNSGNAAGDAGSALTYYTDSTTNHSTKLSTGYIIYNFWLDAINLRLNIEQYSNLWYNIFEQIKLKYNNPDSPLYVPEHIRIGDRTNDIRLPWDIEYIIKMSHKFLDDLKYYWVPRYILAQKEKGLKDSEVALFSLAKKNIVLQSNSSPYVNDKVKPFSWCPSLQPKSVKFDRKDSTKSGRSSARSSIAGSKNPSLNKLHVNYPIHNKNQNGDELEKLDTFDEDEIYEDQNSKSNNRRHSMAVSEIVDDYETLTERSSVNSKHWLINDTHSDDSEDNNTSYSEEHHNDYKRKKVTINSETENDEEKNQNHRSALSKKSQEKSILSSKRSSTTKATNGRKSTRRSGSREKSSRKEKPVISNVMKPNKSATVSITAEKSSCSGETKTSFEDSEKTGLNSLQSDDRSRYSIGNSTINGTKLPTYRRKSEGGNTFMQSSPRSSGVSVPMLFCLKKMAADQINSFVSQSSLSTNSGVSINTQTMFAQTNKIFNSKCIVNETIKKMSTLAMMGRTKNKPGMFGRNGSTGMAGTSNNAFEVVTNQNQKNKSEKMSKITVKASSHHNKLINSPSARMKNSKHGISSQSNFSSNNTVLSSESSTSSDDVEIHTYSLGFSEVGKSDIKKIKQKRKKNTFAFAISDAVKGNGQDDDQDNFEDDESVDSKGSTLKPIEFKLGKAALSKATTNKAKERRKKWEELKKRQEKDERKANRKLKRSRNRLISNNDVDAYEKTFGIIGTFEYQRNMVLGFINNNEDREYRNKNLRSILAYQTDEYCGYPFREFLNNREEYWDLPYTLLSLLTVWVDIDKLRRYTQIGSDIADLTIYRTYYRQLVDRVIVDESILEGFINPIIKDEILATNENEVFNIPVAWIRLQRDIHESLEPLFNEFLEEDRQSFFDYAFKKKKVNDVNRRSVSFNIENDFYDHNEGYGLPSVQMVSRRMTRSSIFLVDLALIHMFKTNNPVQDFSDDNGEVKNEYQNSVEPKLVNPQLEGLNLANKKKMTNTEILNSAKLEYPAKGYSRKNYKISSDVNYMRSIRKNGIIITRPKQKPKSMKDIFKNQTYYEYFRKFLRHFGVERMLTFWKAIEIMKTTASIKGRQQKAQTVMEKYFHNPEKSPAEILFCSAPIILEIPNLEIVTTSMLFSAQQTISHQMELNWFKKFCDTFASTAEKKQLENEAEMQAEEESKADDLGTNIGFGTYKPNAVIARGLRATLGLGVGGVHGGPLSGGMRPNANFLRQKIDSGLPDDPNAVDNDTRSRLLKSWIALSNWFRAASKFIKCMQKGDEYQLFSSFLKRVGKRGVPGTTTDSRGNMLASTVSLPDQGEGDRQTSTGRPTGLDFDYSLKSMQTPQPAKKVICGQLVTLVNLANDLDFWIETDRFKELFNTDDTKSLRNFKDQSIFQKANIIKDLFLEPRILENQLQNNVNLPTFAKIETFINVPKDICDNISSSISSGIIDRTLFSDGVSYIFPVLIHFWRLYRESYAVTHYNKWLNLIDGLKELKLKQAKERSRAGKKRKGGTVSTGSSNPEIEKIRKKSLKSSRDLLIPVIDKHVQRKNKELSLKTVLSNPLSRKLIESGDAFAIRKPGSGKNLKTKLTKAVIKKSNISHFEYFDNDNVMMAVPRFSETTMMYKEMDREDKRLCRKAARAAALAGGKNSVEDPIIPVLNQVAQPLADLPSTPPSLNQAIKERRKSAAYTARKTVKINVKSSNTSQNTNYSAKLNDKNDGHADDRDDNDKTPKSPEKQTDQNQNHQKDRRKSQTPYTNIAMGSKISYSVSAGPILHIHKPNSVDNFIKTLHTKIPLDKDNKNSDKHPNNKEGGLYTVVVDNDESSLNGKMGDGSKDLRTSSSLHHSASKTGAHGDKISLTNITSDEKFRIGMRKLDRKHDKEFAKAAKKMDVILKEQRREIRKRMKFH